MVNADEYGFSGSTGSATETTGRGRNVIIAAKAPISVAIPNSQAHSDVLALVFCALVLGICFVFSGFILFDIWSHQIKTIL